MARVLVNVPAKAKRGEIIVVKTLVSHHMESGFRYTTTGAPIPRDIVTLFVASYDGEEIFRAELSPAISANPYLSFHTVATRSGAIRLEWSGDNGFLLVEHAQITVD